MTTASRTRKNRLALFTSALLFGAYITSAQAAPLDLTGWSQEGVPNGWDPSPSWVVDTSGTAVTQKTNTYPSFFASDFDSITNLSDLSITLNTSYAGGDDDFVGFALGFNAGDSTNSNADYLLVDWKKTTQTFNGSLATAGLAISHVTGAIDSYPAWSHSGNINELERATTLGNTGWQHGIDYIFDIDFTATELNISVNGTNQFSMAGAFSNGGLAFYNFSQSVTAYQADAVMVSAPEQGIAFMLSLGLLGMALARKKIA